MPPQPATALRGLVALARGDRFLVIDPGKRTGVCVHDSVGWSPWTVGLDELPALLDNLLPAMKFVVCEDFHLVGGQRRSAGATDMPSSRGIGMCWLACEWRDVPLYLVQPNCKSAGRGALNAAGVAARDACRNEHERDVVDITGYVLREMRR